MVGVVGSSPIAPTNSFSFRTRARSGPHVSGSGRSNRCTPLREWNPARSRSHRPQYRRHEASASSLSSIGLPGAPVIENGLLLALARGGRGLFRNSDVAIVIAAVVLAITHLPLDTAKLIAVFFTFLLQATVILSRRLPKPFLTAWGIHVAHDVSHGIRPRGRVTSQHRAPNPLRA